MLLEFEKPIALLEDRLKALKLKSIEGDNSPSLTKAIEKLDKDIKSLKKEVYSSLTNWQRVQLSRHPERPYTIDYLSRITEEFVELHGDRISGDDNTIVGGLGNIEGKSIMFIGHQKGRNTKERQFRRFGMSNPQGYRKALRLMRLAEKFNKPIVCFIDTPGAYPGIEAEEKGQANAIATNIQSMFNIKVPILVIIIGEGASGGALGIGIGDKVLMLENTWYSVITPESCSAILWKTWDYKEQAATNLHLIPEHMLKMKLIDGIIKEPLGGAHKNIPEIAEKLKHEILINLELLEKFPVKKLISNRIKKFCDMGVIKE